MTTPTDTCWPRAALLAAGSGLVFGVHKVLVFCDQCGFSRSHCSPAFPKTVSMEQTAQLG